MSVKKQTSIAIEIGLDENKIPEEIHWSAPDGGVEHQEAKAMMLAFWDPGQKETMRMDLWVKDMPVDQMQQFFHQTLVTMSDTYFRATQDEKMQATMRDFCDYFAEKLNLIKS